MRFYGESNRYVDPYKDYDWDNDGFPGEFVYGDDVYLDDYYMGEVWKPIECFEDYWVSDRGRIYSTISDKFMYGTPTGCCGHLDVSLRANGKRYHAYIHRLVAEAFIPNPYNLPIVRHLDDDPSNNDVENLAWGTQYDNIQDCISSKRFRYFTGDDIELANSKRRTPIIATNLKTHEEIYFISQQEASRMLGIDQSAISAVIRGLSRHAKGYYFRYADQSLDIDLDSYKYSKKGTKIKAIHLNTGEEYIFGSQTEAAMELGMSIASVSTILSGKTYKAKGFTFEYVDEEEFDE